jgi:hypothetical protein
MKSLIRKYLHSHKSELYPGQILNFSDNSEGTLSEVYIQIDYIGTLLISYFEL